MIRDLILSLVSFLVVEPLQAELTDRMAAARVPPAVVAQVTQCATTATPRLADRALSDPWWGVRTTFDVWMGTTSPEAVLGTATPSCTQALQAARPFLDGLRA